MTTSSRQPSIYTDPGENNDDASPAAKRRRVAAACDQCRFKKIKCDATKPVCGPCLRRYGPSPTCEWGVRRGRGAAKTKTEEVIRLKRRIEELEQTRRRGSPEPASYHLVTSPQTPDSPDDVQEPLLESNAMLGFVEPEEDTSPQNYGQSNATSFMNLIRSLIDQDRSVPGSAISRVSENTPSRKSHGRKSSIRRPLPDYALPSRQQADHLLWVYRQLIATLYPFVDLDQVDTLYQRLWTGEDLGDDGLTFICLINVIFSIACNLDSSIPPQERVQHANVFYTRAQNLLQLDIVQERSVLTVQCFLLLGQYLQSTNDPQQCWIYVGFAIRIAQSLRLDIPSTSSKEPLPMREMYRRVWHGCVLMDQALSMTFGRPAMIPFQLSASIPLPMAHPDSADCQCCTTCLFDSSTADFHFFIETLKLYRLMNETLIILYSPESTQEAGGNPNITYFGPLATKAVANLLDLDYKLSCWYQSLPIHLRHGSGSTGSPIHTRQRNVLYIRYSHVNILLFRPVLARYCSSRVTQDVNSKPSSDALPRQIALQFSVACIKAAIKTVQCFDEALSGRDIGDVDDLLPAWWYSIFYVYTAATVLVAARLNASILEEVTEMAVTDAWVRALEILNRFQAYTKLAKRCSTALSLLLTQVLQQGQPSASSRNRPSVAMVSNPMPATGLASGAALFQEPTTPHAGIHTQNWAPADVGFVGMPDSIAMTTEANIEDLVRHFNTSGIQVDIFGDMSWLTGMPSQLY